MADEEYEQRHVHSVYNQIANHFSSTRYKPWPVVDDFLRNLRPGSTGLDVGCGNGKYLQVNKEVFIVGSDRSDALTKIASHHQPHDALVADILSLPHTPGTFDFAICIAVIHHLSTRERRIQAVRAVLETLRLPSSSPSGEPVAPVSESESDHHAEGSGKVVGDERGGQALIFVWALEQKASRRGWDLGDEQDRLVPWVLKNQPVKAKGRSKPKGQRHDAQADDRGVGQNESEAEEKQDSSETQCGDEIQSGNGGEQKTFQRYYHLYREGEVEEDVVSAGGRVVRKGYDRDNWWVVAERIS